MYTHVYIYIHVFIYIYIYMRRRILHGGVRVDAPFGIVQPALDVGDLRGEWGNIYYNLLVNLRMKPNEHVKLIK